MQRYTILSLLIALTACNQQPEGGRSITITSGNESAAIVGGGCDGCQLMFVGMPKQITAVDTSAGWSESGQKLLIQGTIFQMDGKTPAPDVVLYYWQTDNNGYYSPAPGLDKGAERHGHIRGWLKTGPDGRYALYTIRPAPYPNDTMPAHIHLSVKEPGIDNEYYIDEFVFDDDPLLTYEKRSAAQNRGGSGILKITTAGRLQKAQHDIVLGLNIPDHPDAIGIIGGIKARATVKVKQ